MIFVAAADPKQYVLSAAARSCLQILPETVVAADMIWPAAIDSKYCCRELDHSPSERTQQIQHAVAHTPAGVLHHRKSLSFPGRLLARPGRW